jgi:O-succinylbenzoic acid--CoA ligase
VVEAALDDEALLPEGTALVVPTSGSTGEPRAIVLGHAALAASTAASLAALGCAPSERWALALPLRHVAGLQVLARARALDTSPHVVPDPGDPHAVAAAAKHAEHIALVPTQLVRCLDAGAEVVTALARFRSVLVGGGPLAPERIAQARAAGVALTLSYGMTETCGGCVYDGQPLPGVEVAIDAPPGAPSDTPGRIRLRGPMLATGQLDPSPEDAARFIADGWFVTDDIGRLTGDETLEALGRADAVINTGGLKVDPSAVEALLRANPAVADAVVLGVPDPEWGERVIAIVAAEAPSSPPTLDVLRAAVSAVLPASHAPRELRLVASIARDAMGKVSAAERERLAAGS